MQNRFSFSWSGFCRRQEGAATVELGIVAMVLLFIMGAIIDFGHYFYLRNVVTNASREGARYGSIYADPKISEAQIREFIQQKYGPILGCDDGHPLTVTAAGAASAAGTNLTVTVTGEKDWFFLDRFIGQLAEAEGLRHPSGITIMKLE
jgi:Flp pilus assembly protein TadG